MRTEISGAVPTRMAVRDGPDVAHGQDEEDL